MPLTPEELRANVVRRVVATFEEDERTAAEVRARLPEAVAIIRRLLGPRRVVLFGSLARGLFFAARSDVDLAVSGLGEEPPDEMRDALRALLGRRVDLVDPDLAAPAVRREIEERGIVLHEP